MSRILYFHIKRFTWRRCPGVPSSEGMEAFMCIYNVEWIKVIINKTAAGKEAEKTAAEMRRAWKRA